MVRENQGKFFDRGVCLEICFNSKAELLYEYLLESRDVILLIKEEHGFLVVDTVNSTKRVTKEPSLCYTRAQLDAISEALAELQTKPAKDKPHRRIGFIQDKGDE